MVTNDISGNDGMQQPAIIKKTKTLKEYYLELAIVFLVIVIIILALLQYKAVSSDTQLILTTLGITYVIYLVLTQKQKKLNIFKIAKAVAVEYTKSTGVQLDYTDIQADVISTYPVEDYLIEFNLKSKPVTARVTNGQLMGFEYITLYEKMMEINKLTITRNYLKQLEAKKQAQEQLKKMGLIEHD